jgi:hypothetical protein
VTIAKRPLIRAGTDVSRTDLGFGKTEIFLQKGLDKSIFDFLLICLDGQITVAATNIIHELVCPRA